MSEQLKKFNNCSSFATKDKPFYMNKFFNSKKYRVLPNRSSVSSPPRLSTVKIKMKL